MGMRRSRKRALNRRGRIFVVHKAADRGAMIIEDPRKYFEEARIRAREQVERDLELERRLTKA